MRLRRRPSLDASTIATALGLTENRRPHPLPPLLAEEAFNLLVPHVDGWVLATALADVASGAGHDEEAAVLLVGRIRVDHCCDGPWCCRGLGPDTVLGLIATIRERQGHIDEAIALLRRRQITSVNSCDQLADLLARHDRIEELRAYAAAIDGDENAVRRLSELLEEDGDVKGAIAVYGQADGSAAWTRTRRTSLTRLLARHGRGGEAIAVMRAQADAHHGDDRIFHAFSDLCLDQGRPADALAHLDALDAQRGGRARVGAVLDAVAADCRRSGADEAVERARAHPEGNTWYAAEHIAHLLAGAGRTEEAVTLLQQHDHRNSHDLAGYLIDLGRVEVALAILLHANPRHRSCRRHTCGPTSHPSEVLTGYGR